MRPGSPLEEKHGILQTPLLSICSFASRNNHGLFSEVSSLKEELRFVGQLYFQGDGGCVGLGSVEGINTHVYFLTRQLTPLEKWGMETVRL